MNNLMKVAVAFLLVLAACGGGEGDGTTTTNAGAGGVTTTAAGATTTAAPATTSPPVGSGDDFCVFLVEYSENTDFSPIGMSAAEIEKLFNDNLDAIEQALTIAPSEVRDDVAMFADAYEGFVGFLSEYNYNFLAIPESALQDPRLQALEDPELTAAGERIGAFCGIDDFATGAPGDGGSAAPSLPEVFPAELVPPGGVVVSALAIAGTNTVSFETDTPVEDVIAYYVGVLGDPLQELDDPKGALWISEEDGFLNVVVSETSPDTVAVSVTSTG